MPFDLQGYVNQQVQAGAKKIVIPPGRYLVTPAGRVHLRLANLEDVEIVATGVEMICTETTLALSIEKCRNLTLRGLTIDYDPLPFTQGRITAMAPDKSWLEFELFDGYPDQELERRIQIFDPKTHELKRGDHWDWQPLESLGNRRYRVAKAKDYRYRPDVDLEEVGDILVTNNNHAPGGQIPHAIVTSQSSGVVLEDIRLYASNCFSYLEYNCDGTTYRRCSIDRRPPEDDPQPRAIRRIRSGNADAFHSIHATRGPQIISCKASYMGDDGVNIRGSYAVVASAEGTTIRLLSHAKPDFRGGDPLELMTYDGVRLSDGVLVGEPEPEGKSTPEIAAFFSKQHMNTNIRKALSDPALAVWKITVRDPVSLPVGSVVCAKNRIGSGFVIKDSTFGPNRSRGILIKGSNGVISGNTCRGNWGPAILVSPEWWWMEAGSSDDLEVSGNTITDCRDTAIAIHAYAGSYKPAPAGAHNRIDVRDNRITTASIPAIRVQSVKAGSIKGNAITLSVEGEAIALLNNEDVDVRDNTVIKSPP